MKWVTQYAKVANIEFSEAAQLMTASINTMGDSIEAEGFANVVEHIADVFLYLGDNAATSGEEIGKAMQKASASATEFGLSFEWLGAYIATVSEQTRQAPESIGNAFNTMLARMHQIKASGFNSEDETRINDVAKALATINVELLDSEGDWRDMSDIYADVAEKWDTLDAKQRAYLATTMAGVRQQNVFYALMNDMSKGVENGSRAWELYTGAMNSAETATEKFAIWQESLAASQANLTNSLEELYSSLQPGVIKGFYELITFFVDGLNNLGGAIPVVIAGLAGLTVAILSFKTAMVAAHPILAIFIAAITTLVGLAGFGGIGQLFGLFDTSAERYANAVEKIAESEKKITALETSQKQLADMYEKIQKGAGLTNEELSTYNTLLDETAALSPAAKQAVDELRQGISNQADAMRVLNEEYDKMIENQKIQARYNAREMLGKYSFDTNENSDLLMFSQSQYEELTKGQTFGSARDAYSALWRAYYDTNGVASELLGLVSLNDKQLKDLLDYMENYKNSSLDEYKRALDDYFARGQNVQEKLKSKADMLINNALLLVDQELSGIQEGYLRQRLMEHLLADDGTIDVNLLDNFGQWLLDSISIIAADVVGNPAFYRNKGLLDYIIDSLFGTDAYGQSIKEVFKEELDAIAQDGELTDAVVAMYEQLLGSGLSKVSLQNLLTEGNYGFQDFAAVSLQGILEDYLGTVLFGFEDINDFYGSFFKETSSGILELNTEAVTMMINLANSGVTLEEFLKVFNDPTVGTMDDFIAKLQELNKALNGDDGSGGQTPKTAKEYIKDISAAFDTIEKIQSLIDSIEEGKPLDIDKLLSIEGSATELTMLVGNLDALKTKLEELRDEAKNAEKRNIIAMLMDDTEAFANSKYGVTPWAESKGIGTFTQLEEYYKRTYGEDSAQVRD